MYQLIVAVLSPYSFLLLALLTTLLVACRRKETRSRPLIVALVLVMFLCMVSTPFAGHFARGSLEWQYPPSSEVPAANDTIVVLAGNTQITNASGIGLRLGDESLYRCLHACDLYQQAGGCRIILSGGTVDDSTTEVSAARAMRDFVVSLGVLPEDIVLEDKSTTTFENARNTSELLRYEDQRRTFLVTSAFHMRRAKRCFARQGVEVIPAPCSHAALRLPLSPRALVPSLQGIGGVQLASHEWLGIGWYWLRGRV